MKVTSVMAALRHASALLQPLRLLEQLAALLKVLGRLLGQASHGGRTPVFALGLKPERLALLTVWA
jgi:hypothetical protein